MSGESSPNFTEVRLAGLAYSPHFLVDSALRKKRLFERGAAVTRPSRDRKFYLRDAPSNTVRHHRQSNLVALAFTAVSLTGCSGTEADTPAGSGGAAGTPTAGVTSAWRQPRATARSSSIPMA
jgi:hypothetical protein